MFNNGGINGWFNDTKRYELCRSTSFLTHTQVLCSHASPFAIKPYLDGSCNLGAIIGISPESWDFVLRQLTYALWHG